MCQRGERLARPWISLSQGPGLVNVLWVDQHNDSILLNVQL